MAELIPIFFSHRVYPKIDEQVPPSTKIRQVSQMQHNSSNSPFKTLDSLRIIQIQTQIDAKKNTALIKTKKSLSGNLQSFHLHQNLVLVVQNLRTMLSELVHWCMKIAIIIFQTQIYDCLHFTSGSIHPVETEP